MTNALEHIKAHAYRGARAALSHLGSEDKINAAAARVAMAFQQAAQSSPSPAAWANLSPESIVAAVGASVVTDLYPGGPMPPVYLVPQGGALQWRITHRGVCELLRRDGYAVRTVPIGQRDSVGMSDGLVDHIETDPDHPPLSWDDLRGVVVVLTHPGGAVERHYVARAVIERRRGASKMADRGPWREWPVEMSCKTAILYLAARGTLPFSASMRDAIEAEPVAVEATPEPVSAPRRGKAALLAPPPPVVEPDDDREPERVSVASDGHQLGD